MSILMVPKSEFKPKAFAYLRRVADRLIVATALYLGASVVTRDERIKASGLVPCIW